MHKTSERSAVRKAFLREHPPRIRFSEGVRNELAIHSASLDHVELMMSLMEGHPLIPFEEFTFGSDVLDFRRGLAYEIVARQLAHVRSLVANVNISNQPGVGAALRCMLEMHAFLEYLLAENRLQDRSLLEKLYHGKALTAG